MALAGLVALGVSGYQKREGGTAAASPPTSKEPEKKAPNAAPLAVQVYTVSPESLELSVPATGRLAARESVDLVSELSRRLKRVRFQEGTQVKKGDVLFELDAADLQAQLAELRVQIELGRVNSERQATLSKEGLGSLQEAQTAQAQYDALRAQQRVLEVTLGKATLRAPFAGTVGLRRVSEGAWLSPNTVLVTLHDTSQLKLDFTIPERYAKLLSTGKAVRFRAEGHAEPLVGTIAAFEPAVEQTSRSILVRAVVNNEKSLLPGTFATVELPLQAQDALLVPSIAVIPGAEGRSVFVEVEGTAKAVVVELGARQEERVQVVSGLKAGDRVIVSNLLRVKDGTRVLARPAGAPP